MQLLLHFIVTGKCVWGENELFYNSTHVEQKHKEIDIYWIYVQQKSCNSYLSTAV